MNQLASRHLFHAPPYPTHHPHPTWKPSHNTFTGNHHLMRPTFCLLSLASVKDSNHLISRRIGYSVRAGLKMQMKSTADIYSGGSWRIWEVIEHLETEGLTVCNTLSADTLRYDDNQRTTITTVPTASIPQYSQRVNTLTIETIKILKEWGDKWVGQPEWQTLLNKKSLLHEIEESITALSFLFDWLEKRRDNTTVTLVDVCCGKGILSMLASYLCRNMQSVSDIIMLDIQTDINWKHIHASNENAKDVGRPIIQTWGGCNLNELDSMIDLLQKEQSSNNGQYALIGIHLCKLLSPSCAGLANALGNDKCTFLCLAPCCMPRAVLKSKKKLAHLKMGSTVSVRTYESIEEREARRAANALRAGAKARVFPCYLCADMGHSVKKCSLLPCNESERISIFEHAEAQIPW